MHEGAGVPTTDLTLVPKPVAIFDLDGTLADTARDLIAAANRLLVQRGVPELDYASTRNAVGMGGRALIKLGYARAEQLLSDAAVEGLYPEFLNLYLDCLAESTELFAEVSATLTILRNRGWQLGVCTNKPEGLAVELLHRLGIAPMFAAVFGGDTLAVRKPDPEHLLATVRASGGHRDAAVMVGDSKVDLHSANAARIPCILMRYGYSPTPVDRFRTAAATASNFGELPELLTQLCALEPSARA